MRKYIKIVTVLALCIWIGTSSSVKAAEAEISDEEKIETIEEEVLGNSQSDEIVEIVSEKNIDTNFSVKEYEIEGDSTNHYLVEGGNENAVNTLATQQNIAQATLVENVNVEGEPYNMEILDDEAYESKEALELRQFITFETKSGKVFHLIIDHSKNGDNVMMLTEVGEQDLLNMIEEEAEVEFELSEKTPEIEEEVVEEKETPVEVNHNPEPSNEESKKEINTDIYIIVAVAVLGGVGGWYFKIFKPKREAFYDEEVDEADYLDDDEYLDETDYLDDDEQL